MPSIIISPIRAGLIAGIIYVVISVMSGGDWGDAIGYALRLMLGVAVITFMISLVFRVLKK